MASSLQVPSWLQLFFPYSNYYSLLSAKSLAILDVAFTINPHQLVILNYFHFHLLPVQVQNLTFQLSILKEGLEMIFFFIFHQLFQVVFID